MIKTCEYCKHRFEGRANKLYCSQACISAVCNKKVAQRLAPLVNRHEQVIRNRAIVRKLYELYGSQKLPIEFLNKTSLKVTKHEGQLYETDDSNIKVLIFGEYKVEFYNLSFFNIYKLK